MVDNNSIYAKIAKTQSNLTDSIDIVNTSIDTVSTNIDTVSSNLDSVSNTIGDIDNKIGETTDDYDDNTLFGELANNNRVYYTSTFIYPTGTSATTLTDASYVQVIPASTITNDFKIVGIIIDPLTTTGWYQFKIATGASGSEVDVASTAAYGYGNYETRGGYKPVVTPIIDANTRISVRLDGAGGTPGIKLVYQEYS